MSEIYEKTYFMLLSEHKNYLQRVKLKANIKGRFFTLITGCLASIDLGALVSPTKTGFFVPYLPGGCWDSLHKVIVSCSNDLTLGTVVHKDVLHLLT